MMTGQRSIYKNLETEAKKLAFTASAEEVMRCLQAKRRSSSSEGHESRSANVVIQSSDHKAKCRMTTIDMEKEQALGLRFRLNLS
ncbi:63 kDa globulin-like protein [Bienertia sinuspersici]